MSDAYYQRLFVGQTVAADGTSPYGRATRTFEQAMSQVHGRYYEQAKRGNIFAAKAIVAAPVIYTTEVGTGGPYLYNTSSTHEAVLLAIGWGVTTETSVEASFGLTGGYNESGVPTATTAIDDVFCLRVDSSTPRMSTFRVATTLGTNRWYMPLGQMGGVATAARQADIHWIDLGGMIVVPLNSFVSVSASATLTAMAADVIMVWEEVPI